MKRIDTTHVGSLPRSDVLSRMLLARDKGETVDAWKEVMGDNFSID